MCGGTTDNLRTITRMTERRGFTGCSHSNRDRGLGSDANANHASVHPKMAFLAVPWRPASSHRVQSIPGPSGDAVRALPEGGIHAVSPSRLGPGPDHGSASIGHPPTSGSLAVSRSSVRWTTKAEKPPPALLRRGSSGCTSRWGLAPRRELPHSLRSACAVSHDLDGLPLSWAVRHVSSGHAHGVWVPVE